MPDPDIFFLPLAVSDPDRFRSIDPWVFARRLPDFLHQLINCGRQGPSMMLEVHAPAAGGDGLQWVDLSESLDADDAFRLLPEDCAARAVITGTLEMGHQGFEVNLHVFMREAGGAGSGAGVSAALQATLSPDDPVHGLVRLAEHLARLVGIPFHPPPETLLTRSPRAFYRFLEGLDGSAVLGGDLDPVVEGDAEALMAPYSEALGLDPQFGLALRAAHLTLAVALEEARIAPQACYRLIDGYLDNRPDDAEACVQLAEHLVALGEDDRARAWLEHATGLEPPPPRALEILGSMYANDGDTISARGLWLDGLDKDGHPDFFAHLAHLAFAEDDEGEAWERVLRGLYRIHERSVRAGEWEEAGRYLGLMFRYLAGHLGTKQPPVEVIEALVGLCGRLRRPEDRLELGNCLRSIGRLDLARQEITTALGADLEPARRDQGVRLLLAMEVGDFERRFVAATEAVESGADDDELLAEIDGYLARQPEFWPALLARARLFETRGASDVALDALNALLRIRPGQARALVEMARLFALRGNPKRALECIEEALRGAPDEPRYLAAAVRYLADLGRWEAAQARLTEALAGHPQDRELRRLARRLGRRRG